jgi:hypothetical protein
VILTTITKTSSPLFSGSKKAAECDLDGSFTAFCIYNDGKIEILIK